MPAVRYKKFKQTKDAVAIVAFKDLIPTLKMLYSQETIKMRDRDIPSLCHTLYSIFSSLIG